MKVRKLLRDTARFRTLAVLFAGIALAARSAAGNCIGDCDEDGTVRVAEVVRSVAIALGRADAASCASAIMLRDGRITVDELIAAVRNNLRGCPPAECPYRAGALPENTLPPDATAGDEMPIDHIVVLMQENRSFDHYFGRLPEAGVPEADGLPPDAANPDSAGNLVPAFHLERYCTRDTAHSWKASHEQYNGGRNDGFVITNEPGGERAMGYYDESDLPFYYALARTFAIADRYFSSLLGPTFPNRFFLYSGTAFGQTTNVLGVGIHSQRTIFDALDEKGVSWKIYFSDVPFALLYRQLSASPRLTAIERFFEDAAAGTLPQVAFVDPAFSGLMRPQNDEHPPVNIQRGQAFVADVVRALISSPAWPRTVFFLTYDEHGGFYDHVPPPPACEPDEIPPQLGPGDVPARFDRYGFRVPFVAVSPWVKPGYVSHRTYDHTSILRFIETRFGLPALSDRDANADPLLDLFDFSQPNLLEPGPLPPAEIDPAGVELCRQAGFEG